MLLKDIPIIYNKCDILKKNDNFEELDLSDDGPNTEVSNARTTFFNYLRHSSIHGLKYTSARDLHKIEKWFWIICLIISFCIFLPILVNILQQRYDKNLIINLSENPQPIWNIPFPAITICPETKSKVDLFNFTEMFHSLPTQESVTLYNLTDEQHARFMAIAHVCDSHVLSGAQLKENIADENLFDELKTIAPTFEEVLFYCKMRNHPNLCQNYFSEVWTEDGLCFSYNIIDSDNMFRIPSNLPPIRHNFSSEQWNREHGYKNTNDREQITYPYRGHSAGSRGGLYILLRLMEKDYDYICRGPIVGFKVLLHSPDELPQISKHFFRVPMGIETKVVVKPIVMDVSETLKSYSPEKRQCYLKSEKELEFFNDYSQSNCEMECLSKYIIEKCECAKFSMPKHSNVPICGASKIQCYHDAEDELLNKNFLDGLTLDTSDCKCLPACQTIDYELEISHAKLDWASLFQAHNSPEEDYVGIEHARLSIVLRDSHFTPIRRHILQNGSEILALCGGLMTFFFGASIISIIEMIYYATFRLLLTKNIYKRQPTGIQEFSDATVQLAQ